MRDALFGRKSVCSRPSKEGETTMGARTTITLLLLTGLLVLTGCGGRRRRIAEEIRDDRAEAREENRQAEARQDDRQNEGAPMASAGERQNERRDDVRDQRVEDNSGWEKLGERVVQGRAEKDTIVVTGREGTFTRIKIVAEHSSLELWDLEVTFGDGDTFSPNTRLVFAKNHGSRVIDLPGGQRVIRKVEFRYGNLPGGGRAQLELWGK